MISEEIKGIVDKFKEQGKMDFLEETTEEKILSFEKEKSVTLPSKYKDWLLFSDGGELFLPAGVQLYGIEHKPLIDVNDNSRPSDDYIVIGAFASHDELSPILVNGEKYAQMILWLNTTLPLNSYFVDGFIFRSRPAGQSSDENPNHLVR